MHGCVVCVRELHGPHGRARLDMPRVSVAHRRRLMTDLGGGGAAGEHGDVLDPLRSRLDRVAHERERAPLALDHELLLVKRTCAGRARAERVGATGEREPGPRPTGCGLRWPAQQPGRPGRCGGFKRARAHQQTRWMRTGSASCCPSAACQQRGAGSRVRRQRRTRIAPATRTAGTSGRRAWSMTRASPASLRGRGRR